MSADSTTNAAVFKALVMMVDAFDRAFEVLPASEDYRKFDGMPTAAMTRAWIAAKTVIAKATGEHPDGGAA